MPGLQPAQSFGPNMPSRIQGTAQLTLEPGEVAPAIPWYQTVVPFYPPNITSGSSGGSGLTADGHKLWERTPSRCDLLFYQGDDVVIPLYFNDPAVTGDDMSASEWVSQIRVLHRHRSRLVGEFSVAASYTPAVGDTPEYTLVEMFLPRTENLYYGQYRWDLYSLATQDLSRFPIPEDLPEDEIWPPLNALRTWLYGVCTIAPRVTSTDVLTESFGSWPAPYPGPPAEVTVLTTGGWTVGPNGRVP